MGDLRKGGEGCLLVGDAEVLDKHLDSWDAACMRALRPMKGEQVVDMGLGREGEEVGEDEMG
jgi:hypothetical protein